MYTEAKFPIIKVSHTQNLNLSEKAEHIIFGVLKTETT
jgi:hypothetical protein